MTGEDRYSRLPDLTPELRRQLDAIIRDPGIAEVFGPPPDDPEEFAAWFHRLRRSRERASNCGLCGHRVQPDEPIVYRGGRVEHEPSFSGCTPMVSAPPRDERIIEPPASSSSETTSQE